MCVIDINDLLGYATCSFKFYFSKTEIKKLDNVHNIKADIYSQLFNYGCYLAITSGVTVGELNKKLNYIWDNIKDKLAFSLLLPQKLSIKQKLFKVRDLFYKFGSPVIYNIPYVLQIGNTSITYSLSIFSFNGKEVGIVKFNNIHFSLTEKDSMLRAIGSKIIGNNYGLSELYFLRIDTFDLFKINIVKSTYGAFDIVKSVIRGIENNIYYPSNDYIACTTCAYSSQCIWSLNKNE